MNTIYNILDNGLVEKHLSDVEKSFIVGKLETIKYQVLNLDDSVQMIGSRFLGIETEDSDWDYMIPFSKFNQDSFVGRIFTLLSSYDQRLNYPWLPTGSFLYQLVFTEDFDFNIGYPYSHKWHKVQLIILPDEFYVQQLKDNLKVKSFLSFLRNCYKGDEVGDIGPSELDTLLELKLEKPLSQYDASQGRPSYVDDVENKYVDTKVLPGTGSLFFKTVLFFIENSKSNPAKFITWLDTIKIGYCYFKYPNDKDNMEQHYYGYEYVKPILMYLLENYWGTDFSYL